MDADVYWRPDLAPGDTIAGPVIIEEYGSTVPVHPGFAVRVDDRGGAVRRHVQVQVAVAGDHRTADVARAVRDTLARLAAPAGSAGRPGGDAGASDRPAVTVGVLVTAVDPVTVAVAAPGTPAG